jgi:putative ABC transport system ATP-binding protein
MAIITVDRLFKDYDSDGITVNAVRGIDLAVERGEFAAIAGPSGSGKTTLLNIIGGLDDATSGAVTVAGNALGGMSARQLSDMRLNSSGFIFQAYNLIPVLSALKMSNTFCCCRA